MGGDLPNAKLMEHPTNKNIAIPKKLPFLEAICWQTEDVYKFTPEQMLNCYERGWKYLSIFDNLEGEELNYLREISKYYQSWLAVEPMIFKWNRHNKILTILESLNADLLRENFAYFGGGTLIALTYGEYRQSQDIDFICPIASSGYRHLRNVIFDEGYRALFSNPSRIQIGRCTSDGYGIRMAIALDSEIIKTEIIAEARFELDPPQYPHWSTVACLSHNDCFTAKLLANSDRYMDDSVAARDIIDLAILRLQSPIPQAAIEKAEKAYEVIRPLRIAVQRFQERADYREKCFSSLQIESSQLPRIIDGVDRLAEDLDLGRTERTFKEQPDPFSSD